MLFSLRSFYWRTSWRVPDISVGLFISLFFSSLWNSLAPRNEIYLYIYKFGSKFYHLLQKSRAPITLTCNGAQGVTKFSCPLHNSLFYAQFNFWELELFCNMQNLIFFFLIFLHYIFLRVHGIVGLCGNQALQKSLNSVHNVLRIEEWIHFADPVYCARLKF